MPRRPKDETPQDFLTIETDELDDVLSGLPSEESTIRLFRVTPQGKPSFITEFSPLDFSLEAIKNTYGGGKYKYTAKSPSGLRQGFFEIEGQPKDGTGSRVIYKRMVNGKLIYAKPEDAEIVIGGTQAAQQNGNTQNQDGIWMLLVNELRAIRESFQRPAESPESIKKTFLEEMMIFKQLFGEEKKSPTEDLSKNVIELIKQGIELGNMAESGGSPWMMVLDKVLPTVQDALKVFGQQQAVMINRQHVQRTNGTLEAPAPPAPEVPLTGFDSIADKLRPYLPAFLSAASVDADPAGLVDATVPNISPADKQIVVDWLQSESCFNDLCKLHPMIAGQRAWWTEYLKILHTSLTQIQGEETSHDEVE